MEALVTTQWGGRTAFVTGATGLLGGWVVQELLSRSAQVVALIRDALPVSYLAAEGLEPRCTVIRGDLADLELLSRALVEYRIDTILHLAAQSQVGIAQRAPFATLEANVRGTYSLLEAARRSAPTARILVASSDKAYGEQASLPYTETAPLAASNPYDASKAAADLLARSYARSFGMPIVVTRCGNLFGGGDFNWDRLIPGTIRSALRGERPVIRSDGTPVRDYLYVRDAALAYVELAERAEDYAGEAFNFSMERPLAVREVVQMISDVLGARVEPVIEDRATGEISRQYLSAEKARRLLGWRPLVSMDDGLRETALWYKGVLAKTPA